MGHRPSHDVYQLVFGKYPELEILARGTSLGKLLSISSMNMNLNDQNRDNADKVFRFLSKRIITWNVEHPDLDEDDFDTEEEFENAETCPRCGMAPGELLPTTVQSLMCLDFRFVMEIFFGWMQAVARIPLPKDLNSPLGENALETMMRQLGEIQSQSKLPEPNLS